MKVCHHLNTQSHPHFYITYNNNNIYAMHESGDKYLVMNIKINLFYKRIMSYINNCTI